MPEHLTHKKAICSWLAAGQPIGSIAHENTTPWVYAWPI